jgi:hypothetical protein
MEAVVLKVQGFGTAIDTNYWDVAMDVWEKYQKIIDDEYYVISATICGKNEFYRPVANYCGGHIIGRFKYLPAYYKMGKALEKNKKYHVATEDDDDDDDSDEDVRDFTPGDRDISR